MRNSNCCWLSTDGSIDWFVSEKKKINHWTIWIDKHSKTKKILFKLIMSSFQTYYHNSFVEKSLSFVNQIAIVNLIFEHQMWLVLIHFINIGRRMIRKTCFANFFLIYVYYVAWLRICFLEWLMNILIRIRIQWNIKTWASLSVSQSFLLQAYAYALN